MWFVIVTLIFFLLTLDCLLVLAVSDLLLPAGSQDEARHSKVRTDLPRPAGGAGQRQAEGEGEASVVLTFSLE